MVGLLNFQLSANIWDISWLSDEISAIRNSADQRVYLSGHQREQLSETALGTSGFFQASKLIISREGRLFYVPCTKLILKIILIIPSI